MHKWPRYLADFGQLWEMCTERLIKEELKLIVIIMRGLWLNKNRQLINKTAQHDLREYCLANAEINAP